MSRLLVAHAVATAAYAGFQWTVRVVVYPQMARVPAEASAAYEAAHQTRVSLLVGPLFLALVLTTAGLVVSRPDGVPGWAAGGAVLLLVVLLAVTALGAVPQHQVLAGGFDPAAHARLLAWDSVRVAVATAQAALAAWLLLR